MDENNLEAPSCDGLPEYTLRVSVRAKRMQLKVNHWGKVEVVVPRNVSIRHVAPFVRRHHRWLERALEQIQAQREETDTAGMGLPIKVHLSALGEDWEISYRQGERTRFTVTSEPDEPRRLLVETVAGRTVRTALQAWIYDYSRQRLPSWLRQLSEECGLPYLRVGIRSQKTRWGSCGSSGNINLNRHLMFLPPHLVRYVMIHELCHTVHLNHSRRYWALVRRFVPDIEECESELRQAARFIPRWACSE